MENNTQLSINSHTHQIKRLDEKVSKLEKAYDTLNDINIAINKVVVSTEYLVREQKKQSERLSHLETKPLEEFRYYKKILFTSIMTAIGGAIATVIIKSIIGS